MSPTLKDVAKKVGVSYATVSRALNNHKDVNDKTRKKVLKIAQEMGYKPNAIAQGLVKKETRTIGLLIPDITNPFFPEVAQGVEEAANKAGYNVFLCNTEWDEELETDYLNVLLQKQVDGLIISPGSEELEHLQYITNSDTKLVFIDKGIQNHTSIIIDNVSGAKMAIEHLIDRGHKDIAFIGGSEDIAANQERLEGYKSALGDNNITVKDEYIKNGDFNRESGHFMMKSLLKNSQTITAVFAANDLLALGVMQAIKEAELNIPGDIAVVGFDDIEFASLPEIQLTTVRQPKYQMGKLAFEALIDQIKEDSKLGKKILLEPQLIVRKTS